MLLQQMPPRGLNMLSITFVGDLQALGKPFRDLKKTHCFLESFFCCQSWFALLEPQSAVVVLRVDDVGCFTNAQPRGITV